MYIYGTVQGSVHARCLYRVHIYARLNPDVLGSLTMPKICELDL